MNSIYRGALKRISQDREKTDAGIVELQKAFAIFQESLDKKDKEIERYKKGYDSAIYSKFLRKFVKFYIDLKKEADAPENQQSAAVLNDMLEQLEDALLECNVELKKPAIMDSADEHKDIISGNKKTKLQTSQGLPLFRWLQKQYLVLLWRPGYDTMRLH